MTRVIYEATSQLNPATQDLNRAQRRKEENRHKVVAAAERLFLRDGFAATTVSDIADLADVAKGSVFTHAPNKEHLLVLVFEKLMHQWLDEAAESARMGKHLVAKLDRFFRQMMRSMGEHADLSAIFMRELPYASDEPELVAIRERIDQTLTDLIDAAKSRGEIGSEVPTFTLARNLFYTYYTAQYLWLAAGAPPVESLTPTLREQIAVQINPLKSTHTGR